MQECDDVGGCGLLNVVCVLMYVVGFHMFVVLVVVCSRWCNVDASEVFVFVHVLWLSMLMYVEYVCVMGAGTYWWCTAVMTVVHQTHGRPNIEWL